MAGKNRPLGIEQNTHHDCLIMQRKTISLPTSLPMSLPIFLPMSLPISLPISQPVSSTILSANLPIASPTAASPIGVFDSGVGGLSVLRHIQHCLKNEQIIYGSDARYAPYGERTEAEIEQRTLRIGAFLKAQGVKAIVVACNTATAVAISVLRDRYPSLIVVGVEPGLKPAAALSRKKIVGVLATEATLASEKFRTLRDQLSSETNVRFLSQPCNGLADRIEHGGFSDADTLNMLQRYTTPLLEQGADTLVLGCTHYPFVLPQIKLLVQAAAKGPVTIIDTGAAVARQVEAQLKQHGLIVKTKTDAEISTETNGSIRAFTSGDPTILERAFLTLLGMQVNVVGSNF